MNRNQFWRRSYDDNREDIPPGLFYPPYTRVIRP